MSSTGFYQEQIGSFSKELKTIGHKHGIVSILRLLAFAGFIASLLWLVPLKHWMGIGSGFLFLALFLSLLKWHKKLEEKRDFLNQLLEINKKEWEGCQGNYSVFEDGNEFIDSDHPYSYDIDLFGEGSLFQFLNRTVTDSGKKLLSFWLKNTPLKNTLIAKHQEAIRELSSDVTFRQSFGAYGALYKSEVDESKFITFWFNQAPFFRSENIMAIFLIVWPLFTLSLLLALSFQWIAWPLFLMFFLLNLAILATRLKAFNGHYAALTKSHTQLKKMLFLMLQIENSSPTSILLIEHYQKLFKAGTPVSKQVKELSRLLDSLDNRNNIVVGILLNGLVFWDWQYLFRIERWKQTHQLEFEQWQEAISQYDALISLANYTYNKPEFVFAKLSELSYELSAINIGHPLLNDQTRVGNDFYIDGQQRYAIVTGANMAGKSTFLRTIAVNLVLAGCGAPVCAKEMVFTPLPLFTSMRNEDSLMKHESYFFAELKRLQRITIELDKGEKLFIILDEILRGTNSEDKRKGSIGFVKKIIQKSAFGLVATHDLELARLAEQQPDVFKALCFEVTIENNELQFNYKLQPGVTKNMNASFLMKQMGIID